MTDADKLKNSLQHALSYGAVDYVARCNYRDVMQLRNKFGVHIDPDTLEQAMRNATRQRESGDLHIWEVNENRFIEEYVELVNAAGSPSG